VLDDVIYRTLCNIPDLKSLLAIYKSQPAIFQDSAPADDDQNWSSEKYPRIIYVINSKYSPERDTSGMLLVNILCSADNTVEPEDFSDIIIKNLSELFFNQDDAIVCALWNRTDSFKQAYMGNFEQPFTSITSGDAIAGVTCHTYAFDLIGFPQELSTNPDPIDGLNRWTKAEFPQCAVIGYDDFDSTWQAGDLKPAIYWRTKEGAAEVKATYSVSWVKATLVCHIFAGSQTAGHRLINALINQLSIQGEIPLSDNSPMLVTNVTYHANGNPAKDGQIAVSVTYGILRQNCTGAKLLNINKRVISNVRY
jgi:hypothetical protein